MQEGTNLATTVAWWGFGLAFIFGAVANRTNFCTMGAISDVVNMGDWNRMRMWLLAIAVAIVGANTLQLMGLVDLSKSIFQLPNFNWLNYIVGGAAFGVGMTLGSGCGNKTLVRIGGGNLKSLMVFVFLGVSAYMTIKGLFGAWRVAYLEPASVNLTAHGINGQDLPSLLTGMTGMDKKTLQIALTAVFAGAFGLFALLKREFWALDNLLGGIAIGLIVVAGWYVSGHIGFAENPDTMEMQFFGTNTHSMESFSFVAPMAYSMELLMLWTDTSLHVSWGIATGLGVIAGSFVYAIVTRSFRWEGFSSMSDTANHMIGGILMGFGGVAAFGCTIGQGITGFSTLALGSMITFLSIIAGSAATMKYQYWKMMREA